MSGFVPSAPVMPSPVVAATSLEGMATILPLPIDQLDYGDANEIITFDLDAGVLVDSEPSRTSPAALAAAAPLPMVGGATFSSPQLATSRLASPAQAPAPAPAPRPEPPKAMPSFAPLAPPKKSPRDLFADDLQKAFDGWRNRGQRFLVVALKMDPSSPYRDAFLMMQDSIKHLLEDDDRHLADIPSLTLLVLLPDRGSEGAQKLYASLQAQLHLPQEIADDVFRAVSGMVVTNGDSFVNAAALLEFTLGA